LYALLDGNSGKAELDQQPEPEQALSACPVGSRDENQ
jgi:hypothetical protein